MVKPLITKDGDAWGMGLDFQALGQIVRGELKKPYDISTDTTKWKSRMNRGL
jgi:hypothetical protein